MYCDYIMYQIFKLYLKNNIYYGGLWRKNHGNCAIILLILSGIPVILCFKLGTLMVDTFYLNIKE